MLTVPVVGPLIDAVRVNGAIVTSWKAVFVAALRSVTVKATLYVPFTANVVENVDAVPLAGLPPVTAHAKVYGDVPPVTVEVKLCKALTVPVAGPLMLAANGVEEIAISWNVVLVAALRSVTVSVTLYVPLTANVVENVEAVPLAGLPPVTAHANVYGDVPPVTVEVKLCRALIVPDVGPLMLAVSASGEIVTSRNAPAVFAFRSVTVSVTLYVPLTANVVEKVDAVPDAGLPPVTAHA